MFQGWRLRLKEAQEAFKGGRLDEASRLLCQGELREFLPAKQLLAKVADEMAQRGKLRAGSGESTAGWHDLEKAQALGANAETVGAIRQSLLDEAVHEAEQSLQAGDVDACLERLDRLEQHGSANREVRQLKQVARLASDARQLSDQGKFGQAEEALAAALLLRPGLKTLEQHRRQVAKKQEEVRKLTDQLHKALAGGQWQQVLAASESILELSPNCATAVQARRRAWEAVGVAQTQISPRGQAQRTAGKRLVKAPMDSPRLLPLAEPRMPGRRFQLWIDGVGGFLVCEGNEIILGQPAPGGHVDVPLLGDLSRQHATIQRNGEGYLIAPHWATKVNERPITNVTSLADNSLIELGDGVRLRFRRPHPLSATARLEFVSHHRTKPFVDGILLMADSCILGPGDSHHVPCRDWPGQVVLFRQDTELVCRAPGDFEVDGRRVKGQAILTRRSRVAGEEFSFSLEEMT